MRIDSITQANVSTANPLAGLAANNINPSHINPLNPVNTAQPLSQPAALHPSEIAANSEAHISNRGQLIHADDALQMAAFGLVLPKAFTTQNVISSNPSVATAVAKNVPPGNYAVQVNQLAQAQTLVSDAQSSPIEPIGSGAAALNFVFPNGTTRSVPISANDNNLAAISANINNAHMGISSRVLTASTGAQLELTGQTGAINGFGVNATGNPVLSQLFSTAAGGGLTQTVAARDAQGSVNGIAFSSSTNAIFPATSGLALNLKGIGNTILNVSPSTVNLHGVQSFVGALNHFQEVLQHAELQHSGEEEGGHDLERSLPALQDRLNQILTQSHPALAEIGITPGQNGMLSIDRTMTQAALARNPAAVAQLFTNHGLGIAERILELIESGASQLLPHLRHSTDMERHHEIRHEYERQQEHSRVGGD